jgi:hypothetical protein
MTTSLEKVGRILLFVIISKLMGNRSIFDQANVSRRSPDDWRRDRSIRYPRARDGLERAWRGSCAPKLLDRLSKPPQRALDRRNSSFKRRDLGFKRRDPIEHWSPGGAHRKQIHATAAIRNAQITSKVIVIRQGAALLFVPPRRSGTSLRRGGVIALGASLNPEGNMLIVWRRPELERNERRHDRLGKRP